MESVRESFIYSTPGNETEACVQGIIGEAQFRRYLMPEAGLDIFEIRVGYRNIEAAVGGLGERSRHFRADGGARDGDRRTGHRIPDDRPDGGRRDFPAVRVPQCPVGSPRRIDRQHGMVLRTRRGAARPGGRG